MGELSAPYRSAMEGFENPTMARVFNDLLKMRPRSNHAQKNNNGNSRRVSNICGPQKANGKKSLTLERKGGDTSVSFLRTMLQQQKEAADSLMETAKKIGPVAQKVAQKEAAYDAAFESDIKGVAYPGSTAQGFTIGFLVISILSFAIITAIGINHASGNTLYAVGVFFGILIAGIMGFFAVIRLG